MVVTHHYRDFIVTTRSHDNDVDGSILASFMYSGASPGWKAGGPHFCTEHFKSVEAAHAGAFRTACALIDALIDEIKLPAASSRGYATDGDVEVWYSKRLGLAVDAIGPSIEIQDAFAAFFASEGGPVRAAVFSKFDITTRTITAYFSSAAASLARRFGALPCPKPPRAGLLLLAGDDRCWGELFPE